jgi:hypothetical protein
MGTDLEPDWRLGPEFHTRPDSSAIIEGTSGGPTGPARIALVPSPGTREASMTPMSRTAVLWAESSWMDLLLTGCYLAGALLVAAAAVAIVKRLRKGSDGPTPAEQLAHYRSLYKRGAINQEEFDRLRSLLGEAVQESVKSGKTAAPDPKGKVESAPPADGAAPHPPERPADGLRPE